MVETFYVAESEPDPSDLSPGFGARPYSLVHLILQDPSLLDGYVLAHALVPNDCPMLSPDRETVTSEFVLVQAIYPQSYKNIDFRIHSFWDRETGIRFVLVINSVVNMQPMDAQLHVNEFIRDIRLMMESLDEDGNKVNRLFSFDSVGLSFAGEREVVTHSRKISREKIVPTRIRSNKCQRCWLKRDCPHQSFPD